MRSIVGVTLSLGLGNGIFLGHSFFLLSFLELQNFLFSLQGDRVAGCLVMGSGFAEECVAYEAVSKPKSICL